jgi:hypothetical protein
MKKLVLLFALLPTLAYAGDDAVECAKKSDGSVKCEVKKDKVVVDAISVNGGDCDVPDSDKVLWRVFVQITDPFIKLARYVTPQIVGVHLIVLFAALWTLLARIGLFLTLAAIGLRPTVEA